ncbi:hypothetical protein WJX72_005174 [[Myrmecia] bisecta]|uniref:Cytochrome b5 heme-binding domain-containing protein n=1 Tax=[Myrmecia] bisecta TaxID=41462 RepID=A0AAW1PX78_9CHLO
MPSMRGIGPLSYSGNTKQTAKLEELPELPLRVISLEDVSVATCAGGCVLIHPETSEAWSPAVQPTSLVALSSGSDCVFTARADAAVPIGCIALDEAQQHNLHVAPAEVYNFSVFCPPKNEEFELCEVDAEVRLLKSREASCSGRVEVDGGKLASRFQKQYLGHVLAVTQQLVLTHEGANLVIRVTGAHALDEEAREEAVGYHCFRGLLTPETQIFLTAKSPGDQGGAASSCTASHHREPRNSEVVVVNNRTRAFRTPSHNIVNVYTRDGEWFPTKKRLLRPCILLTSAVRDDAQEVVNVTVDVDTLVFDRVLIYLEAEATGRPAPQFAAHHLEDLLAAAQTLGLRSLQDYCQTRLGGMDARLRLHSWSEIQQRNGEGACLLILDGMILDVKRWLPEHPGGSTIIPNQALNLDCARFFEVYHASRESFLYLKEFYIGELRPEDRPLVPCAPPSQDFLQQLRQYTTFRMPVDGHVRAFKSF